MTNQHSQRGLNKLISDPYREWNREDSANYQNFADWLDAQLLLLEAEYAGWGTLGYGHWRSQFADKVRPQTHETETAE